MQIVRPTSKSGPTRTYPIPLQTLFNSIRTPSSRLCEPEVIIRRDIDGTSFGACEFLGDVVVICYTVEFDDGATCDACDGLGETVVDTEFKAAGVE